MKIQQIVQEQVQSVLLAESYGDVNVRAYIGGKFNGKFGKRGDDIRDIFISIDGVGEVFTGIRLFIRDGWTYFGMNAISDRNDAGIVPLYKDHREPQQLKLMIGGIRKAIKRSHLAREAAPHLPMIERKFIIWFNKWKGQHRVARQIDPDREYGFFDLDDGDRPQKNQIRRGSFFDPSEG